MGLGKQTGLMAAKILKGEATAEEMPYETVTDCEYYVNGEAMSALGLTAVPENAVDVKAE